MLWRNNGPDEDGLTRFMDISPESSTYDGGWGWGGKFLDYDNDGDLDLFTVNGFVSAGEGSYWYDLASWTVSVRSSRPTRAAGRRWATGRSRATSTFRFFRNDGLRDLHGELRREVGVDSDRDGRGVAVCFDYDNDGDLDIFVANQGQPSRTCIENRMARCRPLAHGATRGRSGDRDERRRDRRTRDASSPDGELNRFASATAATATPDRATRALALRPRRSERSSSCSRCAGPTVGCSTSKT